MSYFNEEQQAHMRYLGTVPREDRCPSGWHVKARETCQCIDQKPCVCLHSLSIHKTGVCTGRFDIANRDPATRSVDGCPCREYRHQQASAPPSGRREGGE